MDVQKKKRKKLVTAKTQEHISVVTLVKNISDALLPLRHFQCAKSEQTDAADMVTAWLRSLLLAKCSSSQSVPCAVCIWGLLFSPHRCTHRAVTLDSRLILISFFFCPPLKIELLSMFCQIQKYAASSGSTLHLTTIVANQNKAAFSFNSVLHWHLGVLICPKIKRKDMCTFSH